MTREVSLLFDEIHDSTEYNYSITFNRGDLCNEQRIVYE